MVKHVVKGEKWACSTLKAGKNKPVYYVMNTRDFKRICEEIKEKRGFVMNPRFGLSDKTWTCGLYHPNGYGLLCFSPKNILDIVLILCYTVINSWRLYQRSDFSVRYFVVNLWIYIIKYLDFSTLTKNNNCVKLDLKL